MYQKNKMHMIPVVLQDMAKTIFETRNSIERDNVVARMEAVRDFCHDVIVESKNKSTLISPIKKKSTYR
jgi:hypothetical protein